MNGLLIDGDAGGGEKLQVQEGTAELPELARTITTQDRIEIELDTWEC